jgi:glycosyltransferase involved in cell wall biosynthesis
VGKRKIVLTYFGSVNFPLAEAARIQFFNMDETFIKIAFSRSLKFRVSEDIYLLPVFFLPIIAILPLFFKRDRILTYGPLNSRLIRWMNKFLICQHLITECSEVKLLSDNARQMIVFKWPKLETAFEEYTPKKLHSKTKFRILFMSHLTSQKGVEILCQALLRLSPDMQSKFELILCNSGIVKSDLPGNYLKCFETRFQGVVTNKGIVNVAAELRDADVYVYPFITPSQTFVIPMSFLEAVCAYTIPIGPNYEFVEDWLGPEFICAPTPECLSEKLMDILDNESVYREELSIIRQSVLKKVRFSHVKRNF